VVRAEDPVHVAVAVFHLFGRRGLRHHAAAEKNLLSRMARLGVHQRADVAEHTRFGVLADGAGVDHDAVGPFLGVGELIAAGDEHPADALGVGLVLLAAVGVDPGERRAAGRAPVVADARAAVLLPGQFFGRNDGGLLIQGDTSRTA